jgi:NADPH-dependent glutamate synthase beta subunit-like oxidoreductase
MVFRKMGMILAVIVLFISAIAPATAANFIIVGTQNPDSVGLSWDNVGASNIANAIGYKTAHETSTAWLDTQLSGTMTSTGNVVIIVGGNHANAVAEQLVSSGVISASQLNQSPGKYFSVANAWGPTTATAVIVSGMARQDTRNAANNYAAWIVTNNVVIPPTYA